MNKKIITVLSILVLFVLYVISKDIWFSFKSKDKIIWERNKEIVKLRKLNENNIPDPEKRELRNKIFNLDDPNTYIDKAQQKYFDGLRQLSRKLDNEWKNLPYSERNKKIDEFSRMLDKEGMQIEAEYRKTLEKHKTKKQ